MSMNWRCRRCGQNPYETGCGMPDYTVTVPYDDGSVGNEHPACPLELVDTPSCGLGFWPWTVLTAVALCVTFALV